MRMALAIPSAIGNEVFVTYIGIGLPVDIPSLGNLIDTGRRADDRPRFALSAVLPGGGAGPYHHFLLRHRQRLCRRR